MVAQVPEHRPAPHNIVKRLFKLHTRALNALPIAAGIVNQ
jgi:hypothetical protein